MPQPEVGPGSKASAWAMLLVVMISIPVVWELFRRDEAPSMRRFRLLVAVAAIVCLAGAAYINEYLAKSELALRVGLANDLRLRLAVEAGKAVGWEWDLKTGRDSWFGDLQTMFGISSDTFVGRPEDFYRYVHPEDRQLVATEVADAKKRRVPYAAEFRVVRMTGRCVGSQPGVSSITRGMALPSECWAWRWTLRKSGTPKNPCVYSEN